MLLIWHLSYLFKKILEMTQKNTKYDKNATEGWALNVIQVHSSQQWREFNSKKHFLGNIECNVWDISSMLYKECTHSWQVQTGSWASGSQPHR